MRRRSDAWMNATQILKVANFDKPQRTRILEREVQKGVHEKIQGGYGKYQGTWVPLERGREIAIQYRVEDQLRPVFDYRPTSTSPPPAPKHITASSVRGRMTKTAGAPRHAVASNASTAPAAHSKRAAAAAAAAVAAAAGRAAAAAGRAAAVATGGSRARGFGRSRGGRPAVYGRGVRVDDGMDDDEDDEDDNDDDEEEIEEDEEVEEEEVEEESDVGMDDVGSEEMHGGRVYTQQMATDDESISADSDSLSTHSSSASDSESDNSDGRRRKRKLQEALGHGITHADIAAAQIEYSNRLLDYFMAPDEDNIPDFLIRPPADFNVNAAIDDEGHTAFHWACAIGHIKMIEVLLQGGADISIVNNLGQTPLIRAIMFTNNYERRTFPKVVDILQTTIFQVDRFGQTVLHHTAAITASKSKHSAARYYIEIIMAKLTESQTRELIAQFLNQQDSNGDTALHIAARNGSRKCIKVFLSYAASTQIPNKQGHTAQSYIYASLNNGSHLSSGVHKSSSSPFRGEMDNLSMNGHTHSRVTSNGSIVRRPNGTVPLIAGQSHIVSPVPHVSEAAIQATQKVIPAMADRLEALASAYDVELNDKEADLNQASQLLDNMSKEITSCAVTVKELQAESGNQDTEAISRQTKLAEERVAARALELKKLIERTQRRDLLKLVREEEVKLLSDGGSESDKRHSSKFNHVAAGDGSGSRLGQELAKELYLLQLARRKMVDEIVELWAAAGVGEKMNDYRRLISLSCGVKIEEIDDLLDGISQALNDNTGE
ncbi:hypothetical protein V1512DRAFT_213185 [Lipomyces arxii]|uniref:uncharacterized protein n=1 Tax=Lipomyces arxii TaxID=56418 RepID=UPI0034CEF763